MTPDLARVVSPGKRPTPEQLERVLGYADRWAIPVAVVLVSGEVAQGSGRLVGGRVFVDAVASAWRFPVSQVAAVTRPGARPFPARAWR